LASNKEGIKNEYRKTAKQMKLIAFSIGTVVIKSDNGDVFIYRKNGKESNKLTEYSISRLRDVGFHILDLNVSSLEEAQKLAEEKLKEMGAYYE
jgi:hypothetical protein